MLKKLVSLTLVVGGVLLGAGAAARQAQPPTKTASTESLGTPAAKAFFDQAQAVMKVAPVDYGKAAALFRQAIDADPRFVEAHSQFMFTTRQAAQATARAANQPTKGAGDLAEADLRTLYGAWAAAQPNNAIYEWALGELNGNDWNLAESHYLKAIAIDPRLARAYQQLGLVADFRGESRKHIDYLKKASDLSPADPGYYFYYTSAMKALDPAKSIELMQTVADKFPGTERGAQGLYWAAFETTDAATKIAIYERLRRDFPPETSGWSESGMSGLFQAYGRVAPDKALALAEDLAAKMTSPSDKKTWQDFAAFERACIDAKQLIVSGKPADAIALIDKTPRPKYTETAAFDVFKALARARSGEHQKGYDELAAVTAKAPTDTLLALLGDYGRTLGKSPAAVEADLSTLRTAGATPAPAFALPDYPDGKVVKLSDYKGKVVLVNFWYPSCGPCRGEFPTLQRVLNKYKDQGFVILALNVLPEEDSFVMPYLRNSGFTFRPLKTTTDWAEKTYNARGFPTNALVDAQGRIVFKPGVIRGADEERTFELQVEALIKQIKK